MKTDEAEGFIAIPSEDTFYFLNQPELSEWQCELVPHGGATFHPCKGQVPNWFHRKMQELCFGVKWTKTREK